MTICLLHKNNRALKAQPNLVQHVKIFFIGNSEFIESHGDHDAFNSVLNDCTEPEPTVCNKDTGLKQRMQKWSRGHLFIVRGGGIIDKWSPLFRYSWESIYICPNISQIDTVLICLKPFCFFFLDLRASHKYSSLYCHGFLSSSRESIQLIGRNYFSRMIICAISMGWGHLKIHCLSPLLGTKHGRPFPKSLTVCTSAIIKMLRAKTNTILKN